jgi:hypothetical protein
MPPSFFVDHFDGAAGDVTGIVDQDVDVGGGAGEGGQIRLLP